MKLIELARNLDPGDTVQVEYRRGDAAAKRISLVAEELGGDLMRVPGMGAMGEMGNMFDRLHIGPPGGDFELAFRTPWGGIELVKLNPDLGDYFGTREGILVVSAPDDSSLALKGGDVILTIGGRKPSSPMHAMRILRSYDAGESVAIEVLRKQKRITVTWKVPDADDRFYYKTAPRMREEPSTVWKLRKLRDVIRTTRAI